MHRGDWTPGDPGPHAPHPTLVGLAANTAVNLGPFTCSGPDDYCSRVTDYSGLAYDGIDHQLLMFGGGHSTTMTDTVFAFDLDADLTWRQLYEPTPCSAMTPANLDGALGAWLSGPSGPYPRPISAHTYDLVAFDPAHLEVVLLGRMFTGGYCSGVGNDEAGPVAHFGLAAGVWAFAADPGSQAIQTEIAAGEYDPVSGLFFTLGTGGLYAYDPTSGTARHVLTDVPYLGYANHLTYFPPTDTFFYFVRGAPVEVWALQPDREELADSTLVAVATSGPSSPHGEPGYDFDWHNQVIGGGIADDTFYVFDPYAAAWAALAIQGGNPGNMAFHALAYDPINNVFVFVTEGRETWAYRYR